MIALISISVDFNASLLLFEYSSYLLRDVALVVLSATILSLRPKVLRPPSTCIVEKFAVSVIA